jgi:hypothetical protein
MTVVAKKNATKKEKKALLLEAAKKMKPLDTSKYAGTLKWKGDPVKMQRKWRDE